MATAKKSTKKITYSEPEDYFSPSMRAALKKADSGSKKSTAKKSTKKSK